jgi:hypothetical protein
MKKIFNFLFIINLLELVGVKMYTSSNAEFISSWNKGAKTNEYYANLNTSVILAKSQVPSKHKQLAANYVLIKKIFGNSAAPIPITNSDKTTLSRHGFSTLENSTISQINKQIEQLKNWSNSGDILLGIYANELFEIRIKELKFLRLTMNSNRKSEFQEGYIALEKYIEYIAK